MRALRSNAPAAPAAAAPAPDADADAAARPERNLMCGHHGAVLTMSLCTFIKKNVIFFVLDSRFVGVAFLENQRFDGSHRMLERAATLDRQARAPTVVSGRRSSMTKNHW